MRRASLAALSRTAALIALGALALHQLRYLLGYGADAGHRLSEQGHGYLAQSLPIVVGLALAVLAACLLRAARRGPGGGGDDPLASRAPLFALVILLVFSAQETLEGVIFAGHPGALAAGGWIALPLAALIGIVCAALDRGLATIEVLVASRARPRRRRPLRRSGRARPAATAATRLAPLAFGLARRPPPAATTSS